MTIARRPAKPPRLPATKPRRTLHAAPRPASAAYKDALAGIIQSAFADGVQAERKRIAEVLNAPGVASYPLLAFELAIDGASVAQVSAVIARMEVAVQARIHPTESSPIESASSGPTIH